MRQIVVVLLAILLPLSTSASIQRTFVSRNGLDTNPCTIDQPCRSFAAAILQTNLNGEIVVNDSAGYGPVTITKAVAIVSPLGVHAGISVFSGDGVTVNAGSTDVVVLRNLYINSQGGTNGITLIAAKTLYIEHCAVNGFANNNINLVPGAGAAVEISDTVTRGAAASGIYADSAGTLTVSIDNCHAEVNGYGVVADRATVAISNTTADHNAFVGYFARGSGGAASMAVEASIVSSNTTGVEVDSGCTASVHNSTALQNVINYLANAGKLSVDHCVASRGTDGVLAINSGDASVAASTIADCANGVSADTNATVRLTVNTITRNSVGIVNSGVATVHSTGDNMVDGNITNTSGTITAANKA